MNTLNIDDRLNKVNKSVELTRLSACVELSNEQESDTSLAWCRKQFAEGNQMFFKRDNLLYRKKVVGSNEVAQLLLPTSYRRKVLVAAHDNIMSMHLGMRKTVKRIQPYFYWPSVIRDVKQYVRSCVDCQLRLRKTKYDRIPITAVSRASTPFGRVNIDLIGPFEPKSARGHSHVLCMIDSCTRWVEAVPLKSVSARETCDALLSIFTRTGIPEIIVADHGTNFVAALTKEMYAKLGVEPRFSTVGHPEGNSLVERFNQTLKRMLNIVMNSENPREWDRRLPYLLWAYRELPNDTTGISPYELLFGRIGRGPLAVLRDSWTNTSRDIPTLNVSVTSYLDKLKEELKLCSDIAEQNSIAAQQHYVDNYNKIARDKSFNAGDKVLILLPNSTNSARCQWQGPAKILERVSPHSYKILLDNGAIKILHVNDLRLFNVRINTVGVVFEDDDDFGDISSCPVDNVKFQEEVGKIDLSHLTTEKADELRQLIESYADIFSDKPGSCNTLEHEIRLTPNFPPKKQFPYRIPEQLRQEVDRQIAQLLEDKKIRPSSSPFAHPIVCVSKPNGDVRVCTDLRYVNSGTIDDAYPIPNAEELLLDISKSKFITSLDCASGYWQIPVKESDVEKTAFVTHNSHFEWLVMPFGLKTAGNTFQRVMNNLLARHVDYAKAYIDDTAVHSNEWDDHLTHLRSVFQSFRETGMTLRLSKCKFAKPEIKFIGHIVGSGYRRVIQDKVECIRNIPEPSNKKTLRSFLGMCSFYRNYISCYSDITLPLTELTKNNVPHRFKFNDVQLLAFNDVKSKLCSAIPLSSPDSSREFIIRCDSSDFAVAASLSQCDTSGGEYPISFVSSKLSDVQRRWSTIEKEAYAVIFALRKFDYLVFGRKIVLFSDHNPLAYLTLAIPKSAKLTRWALSLTRYNIEIRHIKGKNNVVADFLSRC